MSTKPILIVFRVKPLSDEELFRLSDENRSRVEKHFDKWLRKRYPDVPDTRNKLRSRESKKQGEDLLLSVYSIDQLFKMYLDIRRLGRKTVSTWDPVTSTELSFLGGKCSSLDAALRRLLIKHDKLKFKGHTVS